MADRKISQLAAVTTVGDTDEYVVAVSGATKKITGANLKAAVAPKAGTYITQVAESGLSAEQALGSLATGILKNTTTTGVLSIAAGSDLPTGIPIASLADPTTGKVIGSVSNAAAAVYPPGYEFGYTGQATDVTVTSTTQGTPTTIVTAPAITFDGSTAVMIQVYFNTAGDGSNASYWHLWNDVAGGTDLMRLARGPAAVQNVTAWTGFARITPAAATITYSLRAWKDGGTVVAFATGIAPIFIRVTKAA